MDLARQLTGKLGDRMETVRPLVRAKLAILAGPGARHQSTPFQPPPPRSISLATMQARPLLLLQSLRGVGDLPGQAILFAYAKGKREAQHPPARAASTTNSTKNSRRLHAGTSGWRAGVSLPAGAPTVIGRWEA
jgi:hypothetical protein